MKRSNTRGNLAMIAALAAAASLAWAGSAPAATTFSDDFNDGNLADQWTTTTGPAASGTSTIDIENQQLNITDISGQNWGPGDKIASNDSFTFTNGVRFTFQVIADSTPYERVSFGLPDHVLLVYTQSKDTSDHPTQVIELYVDQEGNGIDRKSNGQLLTPGEDKTDPGDRVWTSYSWTNHGLISPGDYLGFRMDKTGWALVTSSDGVHYSTLYIKPAGGKNSSSEGTFATPLDMNFTTHPTIYIENAAPGGPTTLTIDNLSVVPEPGSLALLGLGGLAMLKRRKRRLW